MTQQEIQNFLKEHPGYLKKGAGWIAGFLNSNKEDVKAAKKAIGINTNDKVEYSEYVVNVKRAITTGTTILEETLPEVIQMPRILVLDIETAPIKAYVWRLWKQDVYIDQIISDWFCLSWSAKFLDEDKVLSARLYGEEVLDECDFRIIKQLWNLLNEADIVIAHNGNSFDIPKIKARFAINGLPPTSFYQQIDTKVIAAKEFGFTSNKLDFLAQSFGLSKKLHTTFDLWARCMKGEDEALIEMETYNRHDVEVLEAVYYKLRPYIKNHPNVTLYSEDAADRCPTCGGKHLTPNKFYFTSVGKFQVYKCEDCEALSRSRKCIKRTTTTSNLSLGR